MQVDFAGVSNHTLASLVTRQGTAAYSVGQHNTTNQPFDQNQGPPAVIDDATMLEHSEVSTNISDLRVLFGFSWLRN